MLYIVGFGRPAFSGEIGFDACFARLLMKILQSSKTNDIQLLSIKLSPYSEIFRRFGQSCTELAKKEFLRVTDQNRLFCLPGISGLLRPNRLKISE
jgi:hypothetical protein